MTPAQLHPAAFSAYPPRARQFAEKYLALLQRLPLAVCPSFLKQVLDLDTSFPAERAALAWQFDQLQDMPAPRFTSLVGVFNSISLSPELQQFNWVHDPAGFITILTAHLWSSGQLDRFRSEAQLLFAATPSQPDPASRLVLVIAGKELQLPSRKLFRKLSQRGTALTAFIPGDARSEIRELLEQRTAASNTEYAHWYVDGGAPWPQLQAISNGLITTSYGELGSLRHRILSRMENSLAASSGAEQMRDRLFRTSPEEIGVAAVTKDPVLQRFYTELFTLSSGPQIFSTSFVQWTGRELARRAQPHTLILRYGPRQSHRDLNQLLASDAQNTLDLQGSFQDAEMGAYYNWLEMNRVTAPGKLTFVAFVEDSPFAVVVSRNAPAGAESTTPMTLKQMLSNFG